MRLEGPILLITALVDTEGLDERGQDNTVTFCFATSPFLAIHNLLQFAENKGDNYPLATEILRKEIYVDDILSGAYDVSTAKQEGRQVDLLLQAGGFTVKNRCQM